MTRIVAVIRYLLPRERDVKRASHTRLTIGPDMPLVGLDDAPTDVQAETRTGHPANRRRITTVKLIKD
jgi:hypothetical protein